MNKKITVFTILTSILFIISCSNAELESKLPDNRPDYRQSKTVSTLEIPPDLTSTTIGNKMDIPAMDTDGELVSQETKTEITASDAFEQSSKNIHGNGDARWIEIEEKPGVIWEDLRNFWLSNGLPLKRSEQDIGIMETDWLERASNAPRGSIQGLVDKVFGAITDSGERDKFRVRLDYYDDKTYIYLTHYHTTEEKLSAINSLGVSRKDDADYSWIEGERNPELEMEMLRRISLYLNSNLERDVIAKNDNEVVNTNKLELIELEDHAPALLIKDEFNQSWILLGIAIDRSGYKVKERNRTNGDYLIAKETVKEKGFIFKTKEKTEFLFHLRVSDQKDHQIVVVQPDSPTDSISNEQARAILQRISTEIKF